MSFCCANVSFSVQVGPYNNPQETYPFERIGLCELKNVPVVRRDDLSIGEALEGHEFVSSPRVEIKFGGKSSDNILVKFWNLRINHLTLKKLDDNILLVFVNLKHARLLYVIILRAKFHLVLS